MFLHIRDMEVRPIEFDLTFSPGEVDFSDTGLRQKTAMRVEGLAELLSSVEEIRLRGTLATEMEGDCERCLEPAVAPVRWSFDLFYRPAEDVSSAGEISLKEGEVEIGFYDGDGLDLKEVLREQVLLAMPMQHLCREDCRGLCPQCGANRNLVACSCAPEVVDERWAALRRLSAK
jgi:uncharacterized protein